MQAKINCSEYSVNKGYRLQDAFPMMVWYHLPPGQIFSKNMTENIHIGIESDSKVFNDPMAHVSRDELGHFVFQVLKCLGIVSVYVVRGISPQREVQRIEVRWMWSPNVFDPKWNHTVTKLLCEELSSFKGCVGCSHILLKPCRMELFESNENKMVTLFGTPSKIQYSRWGHSLHVECIKRNVYALVDVSVEDVLTFQVTWVVAGIVGWRKCTVYSIGRSVNKTTHWKDQISSSSIQISIVFL